MSSETEELRADLATPAFAVNVGEYDSIPFEFEYRIDGSGICRDVNCSSEEISFSWEVSLLDGLEGEAREEALRDHAQEIFWDEINDQLDEDRVLNEGDYGDEEVVFACGSSEELERLIKLILYVFPDIWDEDREEINLTICASTEGDEASVDEYCELMEDGEISDEDKECICTLIGYALDLNEPAGFHLEYNDGASGRASGYYESANTVCYAVPRPSFHELAEAREQLLSAIGDEVTAEEVNRLLPSEVESHGKCAVSQ